MSALKRQGVTLGFNRTGSKAHSELCYIASYSLGFNSKDAFFFPVPENILFSRSIPCFFHSDMMANRDVD